MEVDGVGLCPVMYSFEANWLKAGMQRAAYILQTGRGSYFSSPNCHSSLPPLGSRRGGGCPRKAIGRQNHHQNWHMWEREGGRGIVQKRNAEKMNSSYKTSAGCSQPAQVCSIERRKCNCHWSQIVMSHSSAWWEKEGLNLPHSTEVRTVERLASTTADSYSISWPRLR